MILLFTSPEHLKITKHMVFDRLIISKCQFPEQLQVIRVEYPNIPCILVVITTDIL